RGSAAGQARWVAALAKDLAAREAGTTLVIPGEGQPAAVHALAHVLNRALGNVGRTVRYTRPVEARPEVQAESLARLVRAMRDGDVKALLILGGNPVYNAPADLEFAEHLDRVETRIHLGLYEDETSRLCHWHVPG